MTYATKYSIPFKSVNNISFEVKIQKDGYLGVITELLGASQPFTVDINQADFLYAPSRFSKATIRVVTDDYLDDLFSTNPHEYRVLLEREGSVVWRGFITPEIFTQDFSSSPVELEIGCVSAMSTLENIDFAANGTSYSFVSLWSLITKCATVSKGGYSFIYFPWVYSYGRWSYNASSQLENVLENMKVSEQNFFDESGLPMKMSEVLEEICKLLGWTCSDFGNDLYFIDSDHTTRLTATSAHLGKYMRYDVALSNQYGYSVYNSDLLLPEEINMQTLGFAGTDNSIDKIPGFNRITVKTSTYPVGDIFPMEDFDSLVPYYSQPDTTSADGKYKAVKRFLKPSAYKLHQYTPDGVQTDIDMDTATPSQSNLWFGATAIKRQSYESAKPPINYSLSPMIQVRLASDGNFSQKLGQYKTLFEFRDDLPVAAFSNGAIAINFKVQLNLWREDMAFYNVEAFSNWGALTYFYLPFSICIGDKYRKADGTWATGYYEDYFVFDVAKLKQGDFVELNNTKTLSDPYTGLSGKLIKFPTNECVSGKLVFKIGRPVSSSDMLGFYMTQPEISYALLDDIKTLISEESDNQYYNIVNDSFMNEADEINLKISSWDNNELCYSKVLLGSSFLTDNLYCVVSDSLVRIEHMLINRIANQYKTVKDKTTQILKYSASILPYCELSDEYFVNKKFLITGGNIDFKNETFKIIATERL